LTGFFFAGVRFAAGRFVAGFFVAGRFVFGRLAGERAGARRVLVVARVLPAGVAARVRLIEGQIRRRRAAFLPGRRMD
jgi:hypothetical protein